MKKIVLAGGCFWGVEKYLGMITGVMNTKVGYANGITENPTYEQVCSGTTKFAEAVYVEYDESLISLELLLIKFWKVINPTVVDRQGPDIGSQYRTGIFYIEPSDEEIILKSKDNEQKNHKNNIVTEIKELTNFYDAESYHQKYLEKNPNGYCHINFRNLEI